MLSITSLPLEEEYKPILGYSTTPEGNQMATVCMNCLPGRAIFDKYPQFEGILTISHGICQKHAREFMADFYKKVEGLTEDKL